MKKVKNWFIKHKKIIIDTIVTTIFLVWIFLAGVVIGKDYAKRNYIASAEEIDSQDVQPPSVLLNVTYENDVRIPFYLITPSSAGSTSYVGQWSVNEDYYGASAYLNVSAIEGLQGYVNFSFYGYDANFSPTYTFTFTDIYTRFTDQFEWGYIEVLNFQSNITYTFEIYDYRNKEFDYITYNMTIVNPTQHIPISPTQVLNSWGFSQSPVVNPFQYYLTIEGRTGELAYIRSMTVSFSSPSMDEDFGIYYTGNLNTDVSAYLNGIQLIGDNTIEEIDALFVFRSIVDSVDSFLSIEILPNFSFYDILYIVIGIPLTIWILKLWLGG